MKNLIFVYINERYLQEKNYMKKLLKLLLLLYNIYSIEAFRYDK